jgi:hypothetical protein
MLFFQLFKTQDCRPDVGGNKTGKSGKSSIRQQETSSRRHDQAQQRLKQFPDINN